ncbi:MAG TPA: chemotaxis protein CheW [Solirubrobacteraceae bacterium]|nr:chemotaxis protein CheW [Solirubrobacteraceae bacterium]
MRALVTFRAGASLYAIDVEHVVEVQDRTDIRPLPDPLDGVVGLVALGSEWVPALSALAPAGTQVLSVRVADLRFGLLVDEVVAVIKVPATEMAPAPGGQARPVVIGMVGDALLLDPQGLARHLRRSPGPAPSSAAKTPTGDARL